ncbi:MAG: insulinase family protein, partial [Candidatus Moranbacteria bacterium]|nr:insulinase family protein [Candidatus Moranbacteria bacterium]
FNQEKTFQQIKKYFEEKQASLKKPSKLKTIQNQKRAKLKIEAKKTDQTHLLIGVKSANMFDEERYATNLLATILGDGMSSRMFIELREKRGLAYYVNSGTDQSTDTGYFFANAGVKHANLEKTIALILKEFKKTTQEKIPEKEISKAKEYVKGKTLMALESSSAVASYLGNQELFRKEIKKPKEIFQKIDQITATDLMRVAKNIFKDENLNLAVIGPHGNNHNLEKYLTFQNN